MRGGFTFGPFSSRSPVSKEGEFDSSRLSVSIELSKDFVGEEFGLLLGELLASSSRGEELDELIVPIDIEFCERFSEMSILVSLGDRSSDETIPRPKGIVFFILRGEGSKLMRTVLDRLKSERDWERTRVVFFLREGVRRASSGLQIDFDLYLPHQAASE